MTTRTRKKEQPTIADLLEEARKERGLSQRRTADVLDTTPTTYRNWLRGQVPSLDKVAAFMDFTGRDKLDVVMAILKTEEDSPKGLSLNHPSGKLLSPLPELTAA